MNFRFNKAGMNQWVALTGARTVMDVLTLGELKLYVGSTPWNWLSVIGDFTEATFTGYALIDLSVAGNLLGPYTDDIRFEMYGKTPMKGFGKCTAGAQTVDGIYLVDKATGLLVWGSMEFDTPQVINVNDQLRVNVLYPVMNGDLLSGSEIDTTP